MNVRILGRLTLAALFGCRFLSAQTVFIEDLAPAPFNGPGSGVIWRGVYYFQGTALRRSDGTVAGTSVVKDFGSGNGSPVYFFPFTAARDYIAFARTDADGKPQVWVSDGTDAGTSPLMDIDAVNGAASGNVFYFLGIGQIWKTDGTPGGTGLLKVFDPGGGTGVVPYGPMVGSHGSVFFAADFGGGSQLWTSDGTVEGTVALAPADSVAPSYGFGLPILFDVNGTVFFSAVGGHELWRTDGTPGGTARVKRVSGGLGNLSSAMGKLFFVAADSRDELQVWSSDGTETGTRALTGPESPGWGRGFEDCLAGCVWDSILGLTTGGDAVYFFAIDPKTREYYLWTSDGTDGGMRKLVRVRFESGGQNLPSVEASVRDGILYFVSDDGVQGVGLWRSDGTVAGTFMVLDFSPVAVGLSIWGIVPAPRGVFFGSSASGDARLWYLPAIQPAKPGPSFAPRPRSRSAGAQDGADDARTSNAP